MRIFLNRQMLAFFRILHLKQIFTAECVLDLCGNIGVDLQIVNSANNGRSEYENAYTHSCFLFIFKYKSEHYSPSIQKCRLKCGENIQTAFKTAKRYAC